MAGEDWLKQSPTIYSIFFWGDSLHYQLAEVRNDSLIAANCCFTFCILSHGFASPGRSFPASTDETILWLFFGVCKVSHQIFYSICSICWNTCIETCAAQPQVALTFVEQLVLPFAMLVPLRCCRLLAGLLEIIFQAGIAPWTLMKLSRSQLPSGELT